MQLKGTKTEANLWKAFAGESMARNKYTYFAGAAKREGYEQIAAIFEETAGNEREHAKLWFKELGGIGKTAANLLAFRREQTITRLLNENDAFRRWYRADLPDAVRRLHQRAACTNAAAGDCVQRLPEGQPLPDAGQRPAD